MPRHGMIPMSWLLFSPSSSSFRRMEACVTIRELSRQCVVQDAMPVYKRWCRRKGNIGSGSATALVENGAGMRYTSMESSSAHNTCYRPCYE